MLLKVCVNGVRRLDEHPALSVDPRLVAGMARAAVSAGAGAVHVHPKDNDGNDSLSSDDVARFVAEIRSECPGIAMGVTTGAWTATDAKARVDAVKSWTVLPDFASVNWHEDGADDVAQALLDRGIGIEAGIWHEEGLGRWEASALRDVCLRTLIELSDLPGLHYGDEIARVSAVATPLIQAVRRSSPHVPVLLHGEGHSTWPAIRLAVQLGLDTRIGLEDCLHLPDGRPATGNDDLVRAALDIIGFANSR